MVQIGNSIGNSHPYKQYAVASRDTSSTEVTLDRDELHNLIEFIEIEFIDSIRRDENVDNIDYVVSMMDALTKLRTAYAIFELERENTKLKQEVINDNRN